jgi:hypothetical protein
VAVRPRIGGLAIGDAEAFLAGLVAVDVAQLRRGLPSPSALLRSGRLRYDPRDPEERWLTLAELLRAGRGDCEDLAAAVAAERITQGIPARVRLLRLTNDDYHAVVQHTQTGRMEDPSQTGGYKPVPIIGYTP